MVFNLHGRFRVNLDFSIAKTYIIKELQFTHPETDFYCVGCQEIQGLTRPLVNVYILFPSVLVLHSVPSLPV